MKFIALLLALLTTRLVHSQDYSAIRKQLEEVNELDQKYRVILDSLVRKRNLPWQSPEIQQWIPIASKQDSSNLALVTTLLDRYGWLSVRAIGEKANETLFLTTQHADSAVIVHYFPLLAKSFSMGESPGKFYAMMLDRILVERKQKQVYGTQVQMQNTSGRYELFPVENESELDLRRKTVGLGPIADYLKTFQQ